MSYQEFLAGREARNAICAARAQQQREQMSDEEREELLRDLAEEAYLAAEYD